MSSSDDRSAANEPNAAPAAQPWWKSGEKDFRTRLHAWWEGYRLPAPAKRKAAPAAARPAPAAAAASEPAKPAPPKDFWSPDRILVAQLIWGDGFSFPGGGEFAAELAASLIVDKRSTVMDVGCGLGGGTRAIVARYGATAHGFDLSPEQAKAGDAMSAKEGLDMRAPIAALDLAKPDWKPRSYDAVLLRNVVSLVTDKSELLRRVGEALKPGGRLLLLDWALSEDETQGSAFAGYIEGEPRPPYLGTVAQLTFLVESLGYTVRRTEDYTKELRPVVLEGWRRIDTIVAKGMLNLAEGKALMQEAQLWARRIAAIDSGELRVARIEALKKA
ncbi:MAG: methyltransferase [Proteobacteria bacterium]|nr:methyltransferase [Pseudomonadota bacterium]